MSPRPKKKRHHGCPHRPPESCVIKPAGIPLKNLEQIVLELDELEALRLCDSEGFSQEEAGQAMGVSRGTVQRLVTSGRRKVATAITNCQALLLNGFDENSD